MEILTIINSIILLANLVVFGLNLKLYTEYFKDRKITRRNPFYNKQLGEIWRPDEISDRGQGEN